MTDQTPLENLPYGPRPEPSELLQGMDLSGKSVVLTGGYSGIGLEAVRALSDVGAEILVPARRPDVAKEALAGIERAEVAEMDLADLNSVRKFAQERVSAGKLDLLINNAGIMASPLSRVGNGWESQFAINHLGHFVLTTELLPALRQADSPRVVALSSLAHRMSPILWDDIHFDKAEYNKWVAYGQAKTANALFARELNRREDGMLAFSVHPGGIMTDLQRHLTIEEQAAMGWLNADGTMPDAVKAIFKTPSQGTATSVFAAVSPALEEHGGTYLEDCNISALAPDDDTGFVGVRSWACSDEQAERLWGVTEAMLQS